MNSWGDKPPVGAECFTCHEPIREGDRGGYVAHMAMGGTTAHAVHRECLMLGLIGHAHGVCGCTGNAGMPTIREAALELARRVRS